MENPDFQTAKRPHQFLQGTGAQDAVRAVLLERRISAMQASAPAGPAIQAPARTTLPIGSPWIRAGGGGGGSDSGK